MTVRVFLITSSLLPLEHGFALILVTLVSFNLCFHIPEKVNNLIWLMCGSDIADYLLLEIKQNYKCKDHLGSVRLFPVCCGPTVLLLWLGVKFNSTF